MQGDQDYWTQFPHWYVKRSEDQKSQESESILGSASCYMLCECQHSSLGLINLKHKEWQHCFCLSSLQHEVIWFNFILLVTSLLFYAGHMSKLSFNAAADLQGI